MSRDDKFFQFPVSALRLGMPIDTVTMAQAKSRVQEIVRFCVVEAGRGFMRNWDDGIVDAKLEESRYVPSGSGKYTSDDKAVICGLSLLNVAPGDETVSAKLFIKDWRLITGLGRSKVVRVRSDLLWDFHNEVNGWAWREFAVLCGVYSGIGAATSQRLSFDYIGCLASGYSLMADCPEQVRIPIHNTRYTVRKLESRGLFVSICPNARHNFYSNKLDHEGLAKLLFEKSKLKVQSPKAVAIQKLKQSMASIKRPSKAKKPTTKIDEAETELSRQSVLEQLRKLEQ